MPTGSFFRRLWDGLESLPEIAQSLASGSLTFEFVGGAQLIKHSLGLPRFYEELGFELLYLWYDWPSAESDRHQEELERFCSLIDSAELRFRALAYQKVFDQFTPASEPCPRYYDYLSKRYF